MRECDCSDRVLACRHVDGELNAWVYDHAGYFANRYGLIKRFTAVGPKHYGEDALEFDELPHAIAAFHELCEEFIAA